MWHTERGPLSSDWWLKLLPSCCPENTWILEVARKLLRCGRGGDWAELRADKWHQQRGRYWHALFNSDTCSYSGACHRKTSALSSRTHSLEFLKQACDFYESYTVIYENIIPAVYVAVIDLFMKTAIVLRSGRGSQTTERLQVEVIVLWMQWNQSLLTNTPSKQNHCSKLAKPTELAQSPC